MADVNITVDGKKIMGPAGTLLIEACKSAGIEIPSFCYYPGLSLQGACRMCLVEIAKMPKLQTACTTFISEGMAVTTQSDTVKQARGAMLEFVLQNHPLDCPVCDAGGQCELQDATLSYGPGESKLIDAKNRKDEQQWSPVVYFDRPRCMGSDPRGVSTVDKQCSRQESEIGFRFSDFNWAVPTALIARQCQGPRRFL